MNTDTGELRELQLLMKAEKPTKADMDALVAEQTEALNRAERRANGTSPWVPVSPRRAKILAILPPEERPAVLRKWDARKARLHAKAVARG